MRPGFDTVRSTKRQESSHMKFIHAGDIHLDSALAGLSAHDEAPLELLRGATRRAFTALVDRALAERVAFMVLPGRPLRHRLEGLRNRHLLHAADGAAERGRHSGLPVARQSRRGRGHVGRGDDSVSNTHPMEGDEIRAARKWLRERPEAAQDFVFLSERGSPLTRQAAWRIVKEAGERAGLEVEVHPHMLKHSCGFLVRRFSSADSWSHALIASGLGASLVPAGTIPSLICRASVSSRILSQP